MKFEDFFALMKEAEQIQTEASIKISEAIQSLNKITAPFYIQLLRGYADAISELYPGAEVVAKMLEDVYKRQPGPSPLSRPMCWLSCPLP